MQMYVQEILAIVFFVLGVAYFILLSREKR